jgi:hypothetical protein
MTVDELYETTLARRLESLQATLAEARRLRQVRTAVGVGGFLLVMVVLGLFLQTLRGYARDYDAAALSTALGAQGAQVLRAPEFAALVTAAQGAAATHVKAALTERVQAEMPRFEAEVQREAETLGGYVDQELRERVARALADSVTRIHAGLLQDYGGLPADQVQAAAEAAKMHYLAHLSDTLNRHVQRAAASLAGLQHSLAALGRTEDYARLQGLPPDRIAADLYAGILESALYNLQPERGATGLAGDMPAASNPASPAAAATPGG